MTGATTRTRREPSRGKQRISLARGRSTRLAPLPHAYWSPAGTPGRALLWDTWLISLSQPALRYTSTPGGKPSEAEPGPRAHTRIAPGRPFQLSAATR